MMSLEDLSTQTGETVECLQDWQAHGLLKPTNEIGTEDVHRARLVRLCLRRGLELDAVARAERTRGALTRAVHAAFHDDAGVLLGPDEAAAEVGMPPPLLRRVWAAMGMSDRDRLGSADLDAMRALAAFRLVGFPEDALVEGTRVYADSMKRVAEMEARLFHIHIHEKLKASGVSDMELLEQTTGVGDATRPLLEPTLLYFHRKGWERAVLEDMLEHLVEDIGLAPPAAVPGQLQRAVLFTDLSGFTALTAAIGDAQAAQLLDHFSEIVRSAASRHDGHVVKQIGDEFLVMFREPSYAVDCSLEISSRVHESEDMSGVRSGIHWGSVLYREGDYVGTTVNVASRVAGQAVRSQVLVTNAVRSGVHALDHVTYLPIGPRTLKGIDEEITLFEVRTRE